MRTCISFPKRFPSLRQMFLESINQSTPATWNPKNSQNNERRKSTEGAIPILSSLSLVDRPGYEANHHLEFTFVDAGHSLPCAAMQQVHATVHLNFTNPFSHVLSFLSCGM